MGETTGIAWTDKTWNPFQGCHKVSEGCRHCYMFSEKIRYGQKPNVVVRSKPPTFNAPLKWTRPARVFTCSWSDFFIEEADPWRDEAWQIIRATPHLTYQILTKRPERMAGRVPNPPLPNVWLGVSAEDQAALDKRLPLLVSTPAAVRFLSLEPLLGPIEAATWFHSAMTVGGRCAIDWAILGGESGPKARACDVAWIRSLVRQCRGAGVATFVKQLGRCPTLSGGETPGLRDRKGGDPDEWPEDLRVREFPEAPHAL
jgi:protein gp37